jgi:hypothetical protein
MTAIPDLNRIVDRVKKLLALSTSTNPHEAALAAAKAQEILFRHNLSMAMVEAELAEGKASSYVKDRFDSGGWMDWRRRLLAAVARNNFCRGVSYQGTRDVGIVGEPHNVLVVKHLYAFLVRELMRQAELEAAAQPGLTADDARSWKRSFYQGAVRTIAHRLTEQRQRDVAADHRAMALVVRKDQELDEAYREHFPGAQPQPEADEPAPEQPRRKPRKPRSTDGYRAGVRAGQRIPLNLPLDAPREVAGGRRKA